MSMKEFEILGEAAVYPGHPVTIAYVIASVYPSYEEATAPTPVNKYDALGRADVPGAASSVYAAIDFLKRVREGMSYDDAVVHAQQYWDRCDNQITKKPDKWKQGRDQAAKFEPKLRESLETWLKPVPQETLGDILFRRLSK